MNEFVSVHVCVCVRACVCACVRACVCVRDSIKELLYILPILALTYVHTYNHSTIPLFVNFCVFAGALKAVLNEGFPQHKNPFERGRLVIHFEVCTYVSAIHLVYVHTSVMTDLSGETQIRY